ncbi:MAG TPA: hypothetical protein VH572_02255 [Gaiella sp.]|jgi:hypothetical protein
MQNKAIWDRLSALGGVLFVVFFVVGVLLPGSPPTVDDSSSTVVSFFADNRGPVLVGTFLIGLGVLAMIWFVSSLVEAMRRADEGRLATAALIGFLLGFAAATVAALARASLAFSVAEIVEPDEVRALFHLTLVMDAMGSLLFAAFAVAVGGAAIRTGFLPSAWGWVSLVFGLLLVVGATAWSRDGFWSPGGGVIWVVNVAFVVYVVVTSVLHFREVSRATAS